MAANNPNELMTTGDVSKLLGLTSQYIQAMARQGKLPIAETTAGGIRLFRRSDIDKIAEERRKNPPTRGPEKGSGGRPPKKKGRPKTTQ
jgi:excisionase family DNA binding protein